MQIRGRGFFRSRKKKTLFDYFKPKATASNKAGQSGSEVHSSARSAQQNCNSGSAQLISSGESEESEESEGSEDEDVEMRAIPLNCRSASSGASASA